MADFPGDEDHLDAVHDYIPVAFCSQREDDMPMLECSAHADVVFAARIGSTPCVASSSSDEAAATMATSAPATRPQLVDSAVQCDLDDLEPPPQRIVLVREHARLTNIITQQCLHCGALPGRDQQFCHACTSLPGRPAATSETELPRTSSAPLPYREAPLYKEILRRSGPTWPSYRAFRPTRQLCRPLRSVATSLRPQEVKQLGDVNFASQCVSFAGRGTGRAVEQPVMYNRGDLAEDIPSQSTVADLEQYWQRPLGSAWNIETFFWRSSGICGASSQSRSTERSKTPASKVRVRISMTVSRW